MIVKIRDRIQTLRQNMKVGELYDKRYISKLFGICKDNSTIETALSTITFIMPELFETDNGKLGIIYYV